MPGLMFLSKSGQRVDARDYQKRTNDAEGAKLGRDVLQGFWGRKKRQKTGRCARSSSALTHARRAQSADRVRATGDKVLLNQYYCRETISPRGSAGRFHGLTILDFNYLPILINLVISSRLNTLLPFINHFNTITLTIVPHHRGNTALTDSERLKNT